MYIFKKPTWQISENEVTDELLFNQRREFFKLGAGALVANALVMDKLAAVEKEYRNPLKFKITNYGKDLDLTDFDKASSYNNFYEFSTSKEKPAKMAHTLNPSPWDVGFYGECENDTILGVEDILKQIELEERIYRFRCVEGWSMVVPWIGFPLKKLLDIAKPTSKAKYVKFQTKFDKEMFPDQARGLMFSAIPYPYVEGLRIDEAYNELAFVAVGMYGKELPKQNGAPLRLIVPWKYGFKSIKSIDYVEFTEKEPQNTWKVVNSKEYGFYANVNPTVDHPRWSQARERKLGSIFKTKTLMFNGYEKEVGHLYKNMDLRVYI